MAVYLGLGSNLGDRRGHLRTALGALAARSVHVERVSPVVESPALLPPDAPAEWNAPFLNLVAECRTTCAPEALLDTLKSIELELGRKDPRRWAPRPIDIDILLFGDSTLATERLNVPHPGLGTRAFFLTPLAALSPGLRIEGETVLERSRLLQKRIPLWMGIVNLTPDSFSDGGEMGSWDRIGSRIDAMIAGGAHILDFGAESTRPGAMPLSADEEWARLEPVLARVVDKLAGDVLRPRLSIDTYHADVARRALDCGIDIVNDVSGLGAPEMLELAAGSTADFVAMHNLGLPADPARTLSTASSAVDQLEDWLDRRLEQWSRAGIDSARIVFDPGIGFGKNSLQSLEILREIRRFGSKGLRLLVGHSRKSFMRSFASQDPAIRDLVTTGASLALAARGVDILRVHNVQQHTAAWRGWTHLQPSD